MVENATMESKTEATMRKRIKNESENGVINEFTFCLGSPIEKTNSGVLRWGSVLLRLGPWLPRLNPLSPGSVPNYLSSVPGTCYLEMVPGYLSFVTHKWLPRFNPWVPS